LKISHFEGAFGAEVKAPAPAPASVPPAPPSFAAKSSAAATEGKPAPVKSADDELVTDHSVDDFKPLQAPPAAPPPLSPAPPAKAPDAMDKEIEGFLAWKASQPAGPVVPVAPPPPPAGPPPAPQKFAAASKPDDDEPEWKKMPLGPPLIAPPPPPSADEKFGFADFALPGADAPPPPPLATSALGDAFSSISKNDPAPPVAWTPAAPLPAAPPVTPTVGLAGDIAGSAKRPGGPLPGPDPKLVSAVKRAVEDAVDVLGFDVALGLLLDAEGRHLAHGVGSLGLSPDLLTGLKIPLDERGGIVAKIATGAPPARTTRETLDPKNDRALLSILGTFQLAVVPVRIGTAVLAVVVAGNLDEVRGIAPADLEKLASRAAEIGKLL